MSWIVTGVRRSLWVALVIAAGGAAWAWWRDHDSPPSPAPAEWPPLPAMTPDASVDAGAATASSTPSSKLGGSADATVDPSRATDIRSIDAPAITADLATPRGTASVVNALVDAPDLRSEASSGNWVAPDENGDCPLSHPIKANDNSGIFHVPGGRFHERTKAERCYATAEAATADGYREAKN